MRRLTVAVALAGALWSGWWFWASHALRQQTETWFDALRAAGWEADYEDLSIQGFPNRLDTTFSEIRLTVPSGDLSWHAPFLQVFRLTYRPDHLILVWPEVQTISTAAGDLRVASRGLRASLVFDDSALLRGNLESKTLTLGLPGDTLALSGVTAAIAHLEGRDYRLAVNATGAPDPARASGGPGRIGLYAEAAMTFDRPISRDAAFPAPVRINLGRAAYRNGGLSLDLSGDLAFSDGGLATGAFVVLADGWQRTLGIARTDLFLPEPLRVALVQALERAADDEAAPGKPDLVIDVREGRLSQGPVALGRLPPLRLP